MASTCQCVCVFAVGVLWPVEQLLEDVVALGL